MEFNLHKQDQTLIIDLQGRLSGFESGELQKFVESGIDQETLCIIFDMTKVDYLSSAGLRILLAFYKSLKKIGGTIALVGLQPYCQNVLDMAGFTAAFPIFDTLGTALNFGADVINEKYCREHWSELESFNVDSGTLKFLPGSNDKGAIEVMGDVKNVLYSRITESHLCSKLFSKTEYSIGLGGLGDRVEDYLPIMGEMMTIGGTMVWLPTDGYDTPDFLIPHADTGQVTLRTGFNVSLSGSFNELAWFESTIEGGTSISTLYHELFRLSKQRRADYKGVLGLAMVAQMDAVFGSGIKKSPLLKWAPADGEMVTHPSHSPSWFDFDEVPRHSGVTGLLCGIGADLTADLSQYDQDQLNSVFYLNPANVGGHDEMLHNHAVVFTELPLEAPVVNLEQEIKRVIEAGEFLDMRHLLDSSRIRRACVGIIYVQEFRPDSQFQKL